MGDSNILVIDTGSSSMRGIIFDKEGQILFKHQIPNFMQITSSDAAEQESGCFRDCLIKICKKAAAECVEKNYNLAAICFTSQRSSVLALNKEGYPLNNILMWYDRRSLPLCSEMGDDYQKSIYGICGTKPTPILSAPKMLWLKRNHPDVYRDSHKLIGIHDYLLYLCTGNFVTDSSLASRTCLFDIKKQRWSEELIDMFGLDEDKLCEIIKPGERAGTVSASFSGLTGMKPGLPVISSGGDQQCSLLGQSVLKEGDIGITSGTGAYAVTLTDKPVFDKYARLSLTASVLPDKYVLEAGNMAAGSLYSWIRETFYTVGTGFDEMDFDASQSLPGAGGLIMLPDLAGKGCPQWDNSASGSFHNIRFHHKKGDFARAALEGICAEIKECVDTLKEQVPLTGIVTSSGGLSRSALFNQILADMLEIPVSPYPVSETTALGAWAVASSGIGLFESAAHAVLTAKKTHPGDLSYQSVLPNAKLNAVYQNQAAARKLLRVSADYEKLSNYLSIPS